jgi:hypothetical protein
MPKMPKMPKMIKLPKLRRDLLSKNLSASSIFENSSTLYLFIGFVYITMCIFTIADIIENAEQYGYNAHVKENSKKKMEDLKEISEEKKYYKNQSKVWKPISFLVTYALIAILYILLSKINHKF